MRLNGWERLWVVVSGLYLILVALVAYTQWPTSERTRHRDEFISRMPAEFGSQVDSAFGSQWEWKSALGLPPDARVKTIFESDGTVRPDMTPLDPRITLMATPVQFPNDAILQIRVRKGTGEVDLRIPQAYWAVVKQQTRADGMTAFSVAFLFWLIPCAVLLLAGLAVAWIRRGFRREVT